MDDAKEARQEEPRQGGCESVPAGSPPCPVVAIGASAGGLEAFEELFRHMPADTGLAFVLIQHLPPRHETLIPSLLATLTPMPVRQVVDDETVIEPNHVYVKTPSSMLTIDDCVLYVSKAPRLRGRRSPIDRFFRSLAEDQEDEAVGIILSGTGTDGALGLKAIKERGGLTLVQAPATAHYDSMPRGAILTGAVDHVLPVEEMPIRLVEHLARLREGQGGNRERFREEIAGHLGKICAVLRRETGHDFRHYKQSTLVRRVRRRIDEAQSSSVYAYVEQLSHEPKEVEQLFRDLLISVTYFFRDPEAFGLLATRAVPRLFDGKDADSSVRIWVPGCATGEEAYSLAMLLREQMAGLEAPPQVLIFATDIDTQALDVARQALYPEAVASQVAPERLQRFFVRHGNMYQVAREVREMCLFSLHNLIADPPFSRLDLISCRNLLIYLEPELQKKVAALFHYALRPGGFLFLGPSEMVAGQPELFRTLDKKHRLFQSRDTVARPPFSFPLGERGRTGYRLSEESARRPLPRQQEVARTFEAVLLESFAPACVVVNESGDIVYFSPRTGRYLEAPSGTPVVNVIEMARKGLRLDVRTALHKAVNSRVQVVHENVAFEPDGETLRVNVIVRPMPELGEDPGLFMVVFQEVVTAGEAADEGEVGVVEAEDPIVRRLEAELRATRDHLQATLEELESSNEELVSSNEELLSMNEELQSANEELQTSKEELQSVNEELETVNTELKKKLDELGRANSDLQNLFQSTRIATIFVDRELRIKKFTPAAVEVFRLIDGDAGRPIADIAPRFSGVDLVGDIREVLRTLSARERQVRIEDGPAWYLLRVLPYRTVEDVIDGVVLTFLDIGELKQAQAQGMRLARIVESSQDGIIGKSLDGVITSWNRGAERLYGYSAQEAVGRTMDLIVPAQRHGELPAVFEKLEQGIQVETFETVRVCKDGRHLDISLTVSPIYDAGGRLVGASGIDRDISDRKAAEVALREAARRKDEFLALLGHELRNPLAPISNCLHLLKAPGLSTEQRDKAFQTAERQLSHLTRLVDDLLDVARISRGKIQLQLARIDLVESVRTTVEDQRPAIEAAGLDLDLELPAGPVWIAADATRLAQAVGNVLHNARKFTEPGGRISVALREEPEQGTVLLTLRDTGIGMEPELLVRLFEPFSQSARNPVHGRGGLGLGLALVKALTELHGGAVEAASAGLGRGSKIALRLPRRTAAETPVLAQPDRSYGAPTPRRCLVIEDHTDAAESLALLLQLAGHEVEVAFDATSGLEKARSFHPDVVLCDIGLPGAMDGYDVARALRNAPSSAYLIALTGYGQDDDRRRALEAGFDAHLTKPADLDALHRLLAGAGPS